ncbi:MAG: hypothetical protein GXO78_03665 [Calditrichaeota bacterium]|nr:hypothetical protein [Calditrichota bacterium]
MKLHFNFKDLFRAPRIALGFQRIWINGLGLATGYLVYLVFTYLSLLISGYSIGEVWQKQALLACAFSFSQPWFGRVIAAVGVALFAALILMTNTAVARASYMVLRDEFFYTWSQAFRFAWRKWISVIGAFLTFGFMIAFFVIGALFMGLVGRIPIFGEWFNFLLTIPYFFAAILLAFIVVVTFVGIILVPAVIATSDEDALGGVFQSFSMTFNQPWRLAIYSTIVGVLEIVSMLVFALVLKLGYFIFSGLFTIGMGEKFVKVAETGLAWMDRLLPVLNDWLQYLLGSFASWVYLSHPHVPLAETWSLQIAAGIFTFFLIILGGSVLAYGEAVGNTGMTLVYVILYKIHEDENLLEREDDELKEEEEGEGEPSETSGEKGESPEESTEEKPSAETDAAETDQS